MSGPTPRNVLAAIFIGCLLAACHSQWRPTYCHAGLVQEDGGGVYFKRDADGGGRYFTRDGGGRYFNRDDSDGRRQNICRGGVLVIDAAVPDR